MRNFSSQEKWKYLSITLAGIIATGVLLQQASAANPTLEQVFSIVTSIKAKNVACLQTR